MTAQTTSDGNSIMDVLIHFRLVRLLPFALFLCVGVSVAHVDDQAGDASPSHDHADFPVSVDALPPIGHVDFPVSCSSEARGRLERAVAMLHHMMYSQSEQEFRSLVASEPDCAMAHWGIAMTLFHPLWPGEPNDEALKQGTMAITKAASLHPVTAREQAYINAVSAYYRDWSKRSHKERISTWETAQKQVFLENRDDIDAAAFFALARLATAPKGDKSYSHQKEAGKLLEGLHAQKPGHPGVIHYIIHAYDNPPLASRAVDAARAYDKVAPNVPHALHMPTHIFTRLGIWGDSIDWNTRSADAALNHKVNGSISHHYPHALDYLIYACLQGAEDKKAGEVLSRLYAKDNYQKTFVTGYALAAIPARYTLERRQWDDAANLELPLKDEFPWEKFPETEAIMIYARGLGAARGGDTAAAQKAKAALDSIHEHLNGAGQKYWSILVDAQRKTVAAWLDYSEGLKDRALTMMRDAARLEDSVDKSPVTPGSVIPAWELLGEMLRLAGKYGEAIAAYETSLSIAPYRFNSIYGAGRAAEHRGDTTTAKAYYESLLRISDRSDGTRPEAEHARKYIAALVTKR